MPVNSKLARPTWIEEDVCRDAITLGGAIFDFSITSPDTPKDFPVLEPAKSTMIELAEQLQTAFTPVKAA